MTTVVATLNLDTLGLTVEQFAEFAKDNFWYVKEPEKEWSAHVRDLTTPWEPWGPAQVWKEATGPFKPGVYALVYDPKDEICNPILSNQTIVFGESTRPAYHRLYAHVGALRGKSTNMSDKYRKHLPMINEHFKIVNLRNELKNVRILFRPHETTDPDWAENQDHSGFMETQAHAMYYARWGYFAPGNTRDLPSVYEVDRCREFLKEKGFDVYKSARFDLNLTV